MTRSFTRGLVPLLGAAVAIGWATGPASATSPITHYEMPFPCGQQSTGTSYAGHTPSRLAVDWNSADDYGKPVVAAAPGTIAVADNTSNVSYGHYVLLDHGNGESSIYAHLSSVIVQAGQAVDQGTLLGYVGSTGNSTGPHLHFEERADGTDVPVYLDGTAYVDGTLQTSKNCVDVPTAGNFLGTPVAEMAVFRRAKRSRFLIMRTGLPPLVQKLGTATDDPVVGDWDGNGAADTGVFDPATHLFQLSTPAGVTTISFGRSGDTPVAGDWDGNGTFEVGVWRAGKGVFKLRRADGTSYRIRLGQAGDIPVTGDWNGDHLTDVGVYDPTTSTFTLRLVDASGVVWTADIPYGQAGDLPVTGDWDGNGTTDLGVWDPATATFAQRLAASPTSGRATTGQLTFGRAR